MAMTVCVSLAARSPLMLILTFCVKIVPQFFAQLVIQQENVGHAPKDRFLTQLTVFAISHALLELMAMKDIGSVSHVILHA